MTSVVEDHQPPIETPEPIKPNGRMARRWLVILSIIWVALGSWLLLTANPPRIGFGVTPALAHTTLLFFVAITMWAVVAGASRTVVLRAIVFVLCFTVATEFAQAWVTSERSGSILDVGSNLLGVGLAVVFAVIAMRVLPHIAATRRLVATVSTAALLVLLGSMVAGTPAASNWWNCRGTTATVNDTGPLVAIDGSTAVSGSSLDFDARALGCELVRTDEFTAVVEFNSDTISQEGPSRIVTSSVGSAESQVNFHVGQAGTNLSVRMRSGPDQTREWILVNNVLSAEVDHRVAVRVADGTLDIWLDGEIVETVELESDNLDGWNAGYPLIIGDEATGEREFIGTVTIVELYARALSDAELS